MPLIFTQNQCEKVKLLQILFEWLISVSTCTDVMTTTLHPGLFLPRYQWHKCLDAVCSPFVHSWGKQQSHPQQHTCVSKQTRAQAAALMSVMTAAHRVWSDAGERVRGSTDVETYGWEWFLSVTCKLTKLGDIFDFTAWTGDLAVIRHWSHEPDVIQLWSALVAFSM